jgi:hypothetical protein
MNMSNMSITIREEERQMILLALAKLAIERPGWDNALSDIARLMDGNLAMYNEMKKTAELGVLSDPVPDLKSITVEQRLGAAILHYGHGDRIGFTSGLEHALELLRPGLYARGQ